MSRDKKLIYKGDSKHHQYIGGGIDDGKDYPISCRPNDTIYVTADKKAELLKDHGGWWLDPDLVKAEPEKLKETYVHSNTAKTQEPLYKETREFTPVEVIDYDSMTNAELRDLADTDNKRLSKKKLIKMITDKKKE